MKTKVTINGVEYNLDLEKAKELGVLEEKDTRCKSWEEFKLKYKNSRGYSIDSLTDEIYNPLNPISVCEQLTENEAIAIYAFSALLKLRRDWIGDWNPDYCNSDERKYCIEVYQNKFYVTTIVNYSKPFSFPTKELAEEFLKCFEELFEQSKCII